MSGKYITRFFLITILISVLFTGSVAGFFDWFGPDPWEPPEQADDMDIDNEEYITMWGRTSSLLDGVDTVEEAKEEIENTYDDYADTQEERQIFAGFFLQGAITDTPRTVQESWNGNLDKLVDFDEDTQPVRTSHQSSDSLIKNAYVELAQPTPHTTYIHDGDKTNYIGETPEITLFAHSTLEARDDSEPPGEYGLYKDRDIDDADITWNITVEYINGTEIETEQYNGDEYDAEAKEAVPFDLTDVPHGEKVRFKADGYINTTEETDVDEHYCEEWEEDEDGDEECVRDDWDYDYETNYMSESLSVSEVTLGTFTKYSPTVEVFYDYDEDPSTPRDLYYLSVNNTAPIDGVETGNEYIDYKTGFFTARDTLFDDKMEQASPINHYATATGNGAVVDQGEGYKNNFTINSQRTTTQTTIDSTLNNDIKFGINTSSQQKVNGFTGVGQTAPDDDFTPTEVKPTSILPGEEYVDVDREESTFEIETVDMSASFSRTEGSYNQDTVVYLQNDAGDPVDTSEDSDLYLSVESERWTDRRTFNTDSSGRAEFTIDAMAGDQLSIHLIHDFDHESDNKLYTARSERKHIVKPVDIARSAEGIWGALFEYFFIRIFPFLVVMSLINYGLTGQFLPDGIKRMLKMGR